jgi:hypothetical protein
MRKERKVALANFDLGSLREKVLAAYKADDPILRKFREYARRLSANIRPIRTYSTNAVSFVSADGGDNRLVFNPAIVELVRVVDSRGNQCALDAIAGTARPDELNERIVLAKPAFVGPLYRMCSDLGLSVTDLSYLLGGLGDAGKSTGAVRCYRDIVEWAVLYDQINNPEIQWGGDTILIRDGLLRTKSFKLDVFPKLDEHMRTGVQRHKDRNVTLSLVGVAKQSAVLGRLAVALELEATFHKPFPCYVEVPEDVEEECYNFDLTWLRTYETSEPTRDGRKQYQSMGKLYLAKFGDRPYDPVWPVDVAVWQQPMTERILGQLTVDAQQGFPIPDYPMSIQKAHEFAKLTGLEVEVLQDLLLQGMTQNLNNAESERLLRLKYLGKSLAALRYKEA